MRGVCLILGLTIAAPGMAAAQETIGYTYDVHGRVIQLTHCGSVNDERETTYEYDLADNRTERVRDASGTCPLPLVMLDDQQSGEDHVEMADIRPGGGGDALGSDARDRRLGPAAGSPGSLHD